MVTIKEDALSVMVKGEILSTKEVAARIKPDISEIELQEYMQQVRDALKLAEKWGLVERMGLGAHKAILWAKVVG